MSFQLFGLPVSRGIAIGRAVLVASSRLDVAHYYVAEDDVDAEVEIETEGDDADAAMTALRALIDDKFGEGE